MSAPLDLVSVVIPLFNGADTIERTLTSVQAQTWPELEIIVVDDGSTDAGPDHVLARALQDNRVSLIRQGNAGVAAARNFGASVARGDYLAFVDADDLWAPDKIELQMAAMAEGEQVGLVYTWAALIDPADRIYSTEHQPEEEGWVFRDLCRRNIVGNGSSPLIRRSAFEHARGYEPALRASGAQGCEDLLIYLRIAERYEFRVVRRFLTGYRVTPGNMSSHAFKMLRSCELALAEFRDRYPQYAPEFEAHRRDLVYWLIARGLTTGPLHSAVRLLVRDGFLYGFQLAPRLPSLLWIMLKARMPAGLKGAMQRLLKQGGAYRPSYLEVRA